MKTYGGLWGVAVATVLVWAVGCGDDASKASPTNKGGTGGSVGTGGEKMAADGGSADDTGGKTDTTGGTASGGASVGGSTASGGEGGGSVDGAGGEPSLTFQSMPAGIELSLDAASQAAGFTLTSASISQDSTTDLFYTEWYGELHNGTKQTQCLIAVTGDFQNAAGQTVIKLDTYAKGAAYKLTSSKVTAPCMAAGENVPLWTNNIPNMALPLSSIKKLVVKVTPLTSPAAVLHPSTPTLPPVIKAYSATHKSWQISGSATATADIYNASLEFWGKSGAFYVDSAKVFHLDNLLNGQVWAFDTAPLGLKTVTLTSMVTYFSFIDGLKGAAPRVALDEKASAFIALRDEAFALHDAALKRRAQYRQSLGQ